MNCSQVLSLIEDLPLGEWTPAEREAVERHVGDCAACRTALAAEQALEAALGNLPEPGTPTGLASDIAARLAEHAERAQTRAESVRVSGKAIARSDRFAWAAIALGGAIGLGAEVYSMLSGSQALELVSSPLEDWADRFTMVLPSDPVLYVVATGLVVYLLGLYALRGTDARR